MTAVPASLARVMGLVVLDDAGVYYLRLKSSSTGIAGDQSLTFDIGSKSRTITISGAAVTAIELSDWFNQNVKSTAGPTFASLTITDAGNVVLGTTTGTKIGTASTQKIGFFNQTPAAQQADSGVLTNGTTGTPDGEVVDVGAAFSQATLNDNFAELVTTYNAMRTALRNLGLMA